MYPRLSIFTDRDDVVIDTCAGSGSTLKAAIELGRKAYGFEIDKTIYKKALDNLSYFNNEFNF
ncbi:MAG: site-specific DNA-methyltransferase [Rickettsiales bacterium]|nr:site-specific DNA-methyltransferase [Rickettsiales bacterium]